MARHSLHSGALRILDMQYSDTDALQINVRAIRS